MSNTQYQRVGGLPMPSNQYMYDPRWNVEGFPGCCQASEVYRLRACYSDRPGQPSMRMFLENLRWTPHAYPIELGFLNVLSEMYTPGGRELFIAFDSMSNYGDVHRGPFSTKNFIKWAIENNYITATSHCRGYMKGWIFHLNNKTARYVTARLRRGFYAWRDANAQ